MQHIKISKVDNVLLRKPDSQATGTLHLTAHHMIFDYDQKGEQETWVPYPLISLVTRLPQTLSGTAPMLFRCRTFDTFCLFFPHDLEAALVFESIKNLTVTEDINTLYAFYYQPNPPFDISDGWNIYSPREEFARMGVGSRTKAWRFTDVNKDYSFCPSYPSRLLVPARISDAVLSYAAKYRVKARIPSLTYLHWANYATITRSSQPMVGVTNSRSIQDEKLIEAIFQSHLNPTSAFGTTDAKAPPRPNVPVYGATATNFIIDARPTTNAMANVVKGAGTENMDHYKEGSKVYLGIDNIHVMRESLARVVEALREADGFSAASAPGTAVITGPSAGTGGTSTAVLDRQALRKSGWLRHISALLHGAGKIVRNVHVSSSHVLVHCSDGWDRTSQLASLAELCLDPFYRTFRGFQILVEKDWVSFGHRFLDRCGHLSSEKFFLSSTADTGGGGGAGGGAEAAQAFIASVQKQFGGQGHLKETGPIFHQFLECVRQLQRQSPNRFEFNERYLYQLHYHLYSCQFGTFLYNSEMERRVASGAGEKPPCERTANIWDFFNSSRSRPAFTNPSYDPTLDDPTRRDPGADMGVLMPNHQDVRFWHELYGREDEEMNGRLVTAQAVGVDVLGPVDGSREDPYRANIEDVDLSSSAASSVPTLPRSPSISRAASPAIPPSSSPKSSNPYKPSPSSSSPRLYPSAIPNFSMDADLVSDQTTAQALPLSPTYASPPRPQARRPTQDVSSDSPAAAVRSMWASISSTGRAAFSAVQGASERVAKEFSDISGPLPRRQERGRVPDNEGEMWDRGEGTPITEPGESLAVDKLASSLPTKMALDRNPWTEGPAEVIPSNTWAEIDRQPAPSSSGRTAFSTSLPNDPTISMPNDPTVSMPRQPSRLTSYIREESDPVPPAISLQPGTPDVKTGYTDPAPLSLSPLQAGSTYDRPKETESSKDIDPLGVGFL